MKYFLIFTGDEGSREDCSVYYSNLVIANNETDALNKYFSKYTGIDKDRYEALEMKPIV